MLASSSPSIFYSFFVHFLKFLPPSNSYLWTGGLRARNVQYADTKAKATVSDYPRFKCTLSAEEPPSINLPHLHLVSSKVPIRAFTLRVSTQPIRFVSCSLDRLSLLGMITFLAIKKLLGSSGGQLELISVEMASSELSLRHSPPRYIYG